MAFLLSTASFAQTRFDNGMVVHGPRASAHIHTESTLSNSPLSTKGTIALGDGDGTHRLVLGPEGRVLFAYDIMLAPVPNDSQAITVRVKPPDPDYFMPQYVRFEPGDVLTISSPSSIFNGVHTVRPDGFIELPLLGGIRAAGFSLMELTVELRKLMLVKHREPDVYVTVRSARRVYPTISAPREFPSVRFGEAVQLDILFNPSTGEKIFDVIQPIVVPAEKLHPNPAHEMSFERVRVSVNGTVVREPHNAWAIGTAAKITLPKLGTVYLVVNPSTQYPFEPVGRVDGTRLTFPVGNDIVEVMSRSNILKTQESGTVWIYRDASAKPSKFVDVEVAPVEDLLPKR